MSLLAGERLFTHPVFVQESKVADETYERALRTKQEIKDMFRNGAYASLTLAGLGTALFVNWKITEIFLKQVASGSPENVWLQPLALGGTYMLQQGILKVSDRLKA
jgi:hypothetical protein